MKTNCVFSEKKLFTAKLHSRNGVFRTRCFFFASLNYCILFEGKFQNDTTEKKKKERKRVKRKRRETNFPSFTLSNLFNYVMNQKWQTLARNNSQLICKASSNEAYIEFENEVFVAALTLVYLEEMVLKCSKRSSTVDVGIIRWVCDSLHQHHLNQFEMAIEYGNKKQ